MNDINWMEMYFKYHFGLVIALAIEAMIAITLWCIHVNTILRNQLIIFGIGHIVNLLITTRDQ